MHEDILYAVFAVRNGFITSEEFTNIFYSWVVDPSKDLLDRLKQKLGKKHFDALSVLVSSSINKPKSMAMGNKLDGSTAKENIPLSPSQLGNTLKNHNKVLATKTIQSDFAPGGDKYLNLNVTIEQEGRYDIYQELARGGIGRILIATDNHIGREIAIKELLPAEYGPLGKSMTNEDASIISKQLEMINSRFLREARVTGQLEHPSIVPVYEIGRRKDNTLYYTMRFVKGRSMADVIYEASSLSERLLLLPHFRDLCNAISYAHSKNVIHRDIKPENIMIGEFGETVVLDWGLAKIHGEVEESSLDTFENNSTSGKTIAGKALGTPSYMPPEQARGDIFSIDEQSDIYSLGAVLYEILTGVPPFEGETAYDTINMVLGYNVVPTIELVPSAPIELAAISEKALSKEKKDRYQSSQELVHEIERFMAGERISAYEYSNLDILGRFIKNNKLAIFSAFLILTALVVTLIFISFSYKKEIASRQKMQIAITKEKIERNKANFHIAQSLNEKAFRLEKNNKFLESSIFSMLSLKQNPANTNSPYYTPDFAKSFPDSKEILLEAKSKLYRSQNGISLSLSEIININSEIVSIAVSDSGLTAAVGCDDSSVRIIDLTTNKIINTLKGHNDIVTSVDITSDDRFIISGSKDRSIKIWELKSGRLVATYLGHKDMISSVAFSPDIKTIASGSWDKSAIIWDVASGNKLQVLGLGQNIKYKWEKLYTNSKNIRLRKQWYKKFHCKLRKKELFCFNNKEKLYEKKNNYLIGGHKNHIFSVAFSPDGKTLATASWDKTSKLWDIKSGNLLFTLKGHTDRLYDIAFSPNGKILATSSWDKTIKLWDSLTGSLITTLRGHKGRVLGLSFSPNGKILASVGEDSMLKLWDITSGSNFLTVTAHTEIINSVKFTKNGKFLLTGGGDSLLKIWKIIPREQIKVFSGHTGNINGVAYSKNGKYIITGSSDKTARIWDAKNEKIISVYKGHNMRVWGVTFSPDGKLVASASMDKTVRVWNPFTKKTVAVLKGHTGGVYNVKWSPDGKYIASSSRDKTVILWNAKTFSFHQVISNHTERVWGIAFSPDSKLIASVGNDNNIIVNEVATGVEIKTIKQHQDWVTGVSWSPDGKKIISCGKKKEILIEEYPINIKDKFLFGHTAWVNSVMYTHDGNYFVSASDDRTVKFWDAKTNKQKLIIYTNNEIISIDLTKDNKHLLVGDGNKAYIYPINLSSNMKYSQSFLSQSTRHAGVKIDGFNLKLLKSLKGK